MNRRRSLHASAIWPCPPLPSRKNRALGAFARAVWQPVPAQLDAVTGTTSFAKLVVAPGVQEKPLGSTCTEPPVPALLVAPVPVVPAPVVAVVATESVAPAPPDPPSPGTVSSPQPL